MESETGNSLTRRGLIIGMTATATSLALPARRAEAFPGLGLLLVAGFAMVALLVETRAEKRKHLGWLRAVRESRRTERRRMRGLHDSELMVDTGALQGGIRLPEYGGGSLTPEEALGVPAHYIGTGRILAPVGDGRYRCQKGDVWDARYATLDEELKKKGKEFVAALETSVAEDLGEHFSSGVEAIDDARQWLTFVRA